MNSELTVNSPPPPRKHQFSVTEDLQIIQFVNSVSKQNMNNFYSSTSKGSNQSIKWNVIALKLGRSAKQVRERWNGHLNPNINKGPWTREEDVLVAIKQREFGNKWAEIAKFFPGRTDTMVKNRWNTSIKSRVNELLNPISGLNCHNSQKYYNPNSILNSNSAQMNSIYSSNSVVGSTAGGNFQNFTYMPNLNNKISQNTSSVPSSPSPVKNASIKFNGTTKFPNSNDSFDEWLEQIQQQKFCVVSFLDFQEMPPLIQH